MSLIEIERPGDAKLICNAVKMQIHEAQGQDLVSVFVTPGLQTRMLPFSD